MVTIIQCDLLHVKSNMVSASFLLHLRFEVGTFDDLVEASTS